MAQRERYQLSLYAQDLPNKGWFRRPSPYATVKIVEGPQKGTKVGETEHLEHQLSPDWCKTFFLEFSLSEKTELEITVWDYRSGRDPLWIGEARFDAGSVYEAPGHTKDDEIGRNGRYVAV